MSEKVRFTLFVAGKNGGIAGTIVAVQRACAEVLPNTHDLEIIDLAEQPHLADKHHILSIPTLVRVSPPPQLRFVGDFCESDELRDAISRFADQEET